MFWTQVDGLGLGKGHVTARWKALFLRKILDQKNRWSTGYPAQTPAILPSIADLSAICGDSRILIELPSKGIQ